jgi:hypothetical protein
MLKYHKNMVGVATVLLVLGASMVAVHADVIVNDLGTANAHTPQYPGSPAVFYEIFNTTESGNISAIELQLDSTASGSVTVNLYNATGTTLGSEVGTLGTISVGTGDNQQLSITSLTSYPLTAGDNYAIEYSSTPTITSDLSSSPSTVGGSEGSYVAFFRNGNDIGTTYTMRDDVEIAAAPETPMTGAFMGFGALAVAGGNMVRRKLAASSKA